MKQISSPNSFRAVCFVLVAVFAPFLSLLFFVTNQPTAAGAWMSTFCLALIGYKVAP